MEEIGKITPDISKRLEEEERKEKEGESKWPFKKLEDHWGEKAKGYWGHRFGYHESARRARIFRPWQKLACWNNVSIIFYIQFNE